MAKEEKDQSATTPAAPVPKKEVREDRIDDHAILAFGDMGYKGRLPDSLVATYKALKAKKDRRQPGYLTPGEYATVALLSDMADGRFTFGKKE